MDARKMPVDCAEFVHMEDRHERHVASEARTTLTFEVQNCPRFEAPGVP